MVIKGNKVERVPGIQGLVIKGALRDKDKGANSLLLLVQGLALSLIFHRMSYSVLLPARPLTYLLNSVAFPSVVRDVYWFCGSRTLP